MIPAAVISKVHIASLKHTAVAGAHHHHVAGAHHHHVAVGPHHTMKFGTHSVKYSVSKSIQGPVSHKFNINGQSQGGHTNINGSYGNDHGVTIGGNVHHNHHNHHSDYGVNGSYKAPNGNTTISGGIGNVGNGKPSVQAGIEWHF